MRRLAFRLQQAATPSTTSLAAGLAAAIQAVRAEHEGRCDLDDPNTPAATVNLVRATGDQLDYLVLCESHIVLDPGAQVQVITDDQFATAVADIRQAALTGATAIGTSTTARSARSRSCASAGPTSPAGTGSQPPPRKPPTMRSPASTHTGPDRVRRAVLLTDGASRAVERFAMLDWPGPLDLVAQHGPRELIRRVRAAESADATGEQQPRYNRHDGASVALCRFER